MGMETVLLKWVSIHDYLLRVYDVSGKHRGSIYSRGTGDKWVAYLVDVIDGGLKNLGAYSDGFEARLVVEAAIKGERPAEPRVNEAALFDELKEIAKHICDFAYENKTAAGYFFDVVAKDGGVFRVDVSMIRHDAYDDKPIVVLEPKPKDHHLDSCHKLRREGRGEAGRR